MRKRSLHVIMTTLLTAFCVLLLSHAEEEISVFAADNDSLYYMCGSERINVAEIDNEYYLFLPSGADLQHITLAADGEKDVRSVQFLQDGDELSDCIDLTTVTPEEGVYSASAVITGTESSDVSEPFPVRIMAGCNIGTVYYHSSDPVNCGRTYIDHSKNYRGSGAAVVTDSSGVVLNDKVKNQVVTNFHSRGNTSFQDPKKSYQLKFDKKNELINGAGEAKKWVLLAQYKDPLHINDKTIKDIGAIAAGGYDPVRFSPKEEFVNFYYDGEYRGLYLLSEKNEIGASRVDIRDMEKIYEAGDASYGEPDTGSAGNRYGNTYRYQKDLSDPEDIDGYGGFLLEMNSAKGSEYNWFTFSTGTEQSAVNIKSPELGSKASVEYISEYFQEFSDSLTAGNARQRNGKNPHTGLYYYDYCDPDSLADMCILNMIAANGDSFRRSFYFYKDAGEKMFAGPVWDMDLTFGTGLSVNIPPTRNIIKEKPLARDLIRIPGFQTIVKEKYFSVYEPLLQTLIYGGSDTDIRPLNDTISLIRDDLAMDWTIWPRRYRVGNGSQIWPAEASLDDIAADRLEWLRAHKEYLDSYFGGLDPAHDHIFAAAVPTSEATHQRTCTGAACGETIEEACTFHCRCLHNGTHAVKCEVCGNDRGAAPCEWDSGKIDAAPTCVRGGSVTYTCVQCGGTRIEALPADSEAHSWNQGVVTTKPSTSASGIRTYTCSLCGKTKTETVPKLAKKPNPLKIKPGKTTVKYSKVKIKTQVLGVTRVIHFTGKGQGTMTYTKVGGNKKITISKRTGKITVRKGIKRGTYKVKVKVKAAGNANYRASTWKVAAIKIIVK